MLVTVTGVSVEQAPKGYKVATVFYNRDGKPEQRKIMSFAKESAVAFQKLVDTKEFPVDVNVVLEKNAKTNYWDWKDIEVSQVKDKNGNQATKPISGSGTGRVLGSNYETPEERARRQVYIIRQSSASSAIEFAKAQAPKGTEKSIEEVIEDAKKIEAYVMEMEFQADPAVL